MSLFYVGGVVFTIGEFLQYSFAVIVYHLFDVVHAAVIYIDYITVKDFPKFMILCVSLFVSIMNKLKSMIMVSKNR